MPLMKCGKNKKGWRYGKSGKCYLGKNAKEKAETQMKAIKASESRRKKNGKNS